MYNFHGAKYSWSSVTTNEAILPTFTCSASSNHELTNKTTLPPKITCCTYGTFVNSTNTCTYSVPNTLATLMFLNKYVHMNTVFRFNYRATHYMAMNGYYNFLNWFDDRSWYPLGRIVGGTVGGAVVSVQ